MISLKNKYMIDLNEIYQEEGFEVLNFDDYCLLEKHGVLSGDKSCSKFASHLMDLMEVLDKKGQEKGSFIIHLNEYSPEHLFNINNIPDWSSFNWDLPDWAAWELVAHIGDYDDDDQTNASMGAGNLTAHLYLKSSKYIKKVSRLSYSATIQHEMKHYFDKVIKFTQNGENDAELTKEVNNIRNQMKKMDNDNPQKTLANYFSYFFYATSDNEMSAWLEQSREEGIWTKISKDIGKNSVYKGKDGEFGGYKKLIESILLWKEDESQYDKINKVINLGDIKTYDDFKKFMMDNYGKYMSMRFNQKASFEKYMKGYIRILDKQIKKHAKIWADGYNGIDLDETPEEIKDILIKKREERLERRRN